MPDNHYTMRARHPDYQLGAGVANNSPREKNSQHSHEDRAAGLTLDERTELKEK